jgi:hypothetical protein
MSEVKTKRRVLIATPCKGGMSKNYVRSLIKLLQHHSDDYDFSFLISDNTAVNFARNAIAYEAVKGNFDELIQIDSDNIVEPKHVIRLLSHDVDIVAGVYIAKNPGPRVTWLFIPKPGAEKTEGGLLECNGLATGFMRHRVSALRKIWDLNPDLTYHYKGPEGDFWEVCNLFEMRVAGAGSTEERLEEIRAILKKYGPFETKGFMPISILNELARAANEPRPIDGRRLLGEDYAHCRLARKAGFRLWCDIGGDVIPHVGDCPYPITPAHLNRGPGIVEELPAAADF